MYIPHFQLRKQETIKMQRVKKLGRLKKLHVSFFYFHNICHRLQINNVDNNRWKIVLCDT